MEGFNFENIIIGIIGCIGGTLIIKEAFHINHHIYFLDFIERKYGPGSGVTAYRLIGLATCILSILAMIGIIDLAGGQKKVQTINLNTSKATQPGYNIPSNGNGNIAR